MGQKTAKLLKTFLAEASELDSRLKSCRNFLLEWVFFLLTWWHPSVRSHWEENSSEAIWMRHHLCWWMFLVAATARQKALKCTRKRLAEKDHRWFLSGRASVSCVFKKEKQKGRPLVVSKVEGAAVRNLSSFSDWFFRSLKHAWLAFYIPVSSGSALFP